MASCPDIFVTELERSQVKQGICSHTLSLDTIIHKISHWNNTNAIASGHRDIITLDATTGSQTAILSGHTKKYCLSPSHQMGSYLYLEVLIKLSSSGICRQGDN